MWGLAKGLLHKQQQRYAVGEQQDYHDCCPDGAQDAEEQLDQYHAGCVDETEGWHGG